MDSEGLPADESLVKEDVDYAESGYYSKSGFYVKIAGS